MIKLEKINKMIEKELFKEDYCSVDGKLVKLFDSEAASLYIDGEEPKAASFCENDELNNKVIGWILTQRDYKYFTVNKGPGFYTVSVTLSSDVLISATNADRKTAICLVALAICGAVIE